MSETSEGHEILKATQLIADQLIQLRARINFLEEAICELRARVEKLEAREPAEPQQPTYPTHCRVREPLQCWNNVDGYNNRPPMWVIDWICGAASKPDYDFWLVKYPTGHIHMFPHDAFKRLFNMEAKP